MIASLGSWLDGYKEFISLLADHVAVLGAVVTVVLFARISFGVFPCGMRFIFKECGITSVVMIRAIFYCWRSRDAQRLFFEFMLVRSLGEKKDSRQWSSLCDDFAVFLSQVKDGRDPILEIDNCTHLTNKAFNSAVNRYFSFLRQARASSVYSIGRFGDFWHSDVYILDAYIMPSVLLSGLMSRFDSNWEKFINRYRAVLSREDSLHISTSELFGLFSWLLWGPSREIDWREGWDGLCMMAYGDENNSLPVFASAQNDTKEFLGESFSLAEGRGGFGGSFSAYVKLTPKAEFVSNQRFVLDIRNAYFVDKLIEDKTLSFIPILQRVDSSALNKSDNCYATAYLWMLFERDCDDGLFHPETSVAFFEHANLADPAVCGFLKERLIEKILSHFHVISDDQKASTRSYRLVCGMNFKLEEYCRTRLADESQKGTPFAKWLAAHVNLVPSHKASAAFYSFDNFFCSYSEDISFVDVDVSVRQDLAELSLFHATVYSDSFPNDNERESLANLIHYLQESRKSGDWEFHVVIAKDAEGIVAGGVVFDYYRKSNSVVIEFLCVDKSLRGRRIGSRLFVQTIKLADDIARRAGKNEVEYVFCEVESPELRGDGDVAHLSFWRNNWFGRLNIEYIQPPLSDELQPVRGLWLLGLSRLSPGNTKKMDASAVRSVLWNYLHYSMSIANPEQDESYVFMCDQLANKATIDIIGF